MFTSKATIIRVLRYQLSELITLSKKPLAISLPHDQWCRLAYNLPIGASKEVALGGRSGYQCEVFFDEIWVIAK
jgi:hypothetical protein